MTDYDDRTTFLTELGNVVYEMELLNQEIATRARYLETLQEQYSTLIQKIKECKEQ